MKKLALGLAVLAALAPVAAPAQSFGFVPGNTVICISSPFGGPPICIRAPVR